MTDVQQAVPVAQESLFDVQPQVSTIDNGPEPSIREMVRSFYNRHAVANPDAVTEQYFAALPLPCKSGEGAELDLECEYDPDGSYALIWKNGYAITAFPNGKVAITKSNREDGFCPFGCDVSELRTDATQTREAEFVAALREIAESGPFASPHAAKHVRIARAALNARAGA